MTNSEILETWVQSKSKEELEKILLQCINHMIYSEDVRINEEGAPFWESCGVVLGEKE
ncbi:MAG TPA: hypothetical protein VNX68_15690 [Nitrosopumilaceae archaeon]|nr:hypothetical protein [Nitrosopumilaceae archaeon]